MAVTTAAVAAIIVTVTGQKLVQGHIVHGTWYIVDCCRDMAIAIAIPARVRLLLNFN